MTKPGPGSSGRPFFSGTEGPSRAALPRPASAMTPGGRGRQGQEGRPPHIKRQAARRHSQSPPFAPPPPAGSGCLPREQDLDPKSSTRCQDLPSTEGSLRPRDTKEIFFSFSQEGLTVHPPRAGGWREIPPNRPRRILSRNAVSSFLEARLAGDFPLIVAFPGEEGEKGEYFAALEIYG